jgi:hypothetical protein
MKTTALKKWLCGVGVVASLCASDVVRADVRPSGPVILTVTGHLKKFNAPRAYTWDLAMLEALPQHAFVTMTPWSNVRVSFSGPLLRDVLAAMHADGKIIKAKALNDYVVSIPVQDAYQFDVVLALKMDGAYMPVRKRGPLFVVYPYDSKPELSSLTYYERSIWQLSSMFIH